MKLIIEEREGRSVPFIYCDICNKRIEDGTRAEYLIPDLRDGERGEAIVGHTACTSTWEKEQPEMYGNMGLGYLLVGLLHNHKLDYATETKSVNLLKEMFG